MKLLIQTTISLLALSVLAGCAQKDEELHEKTKSLEKNEAVLEAKIDQVDKKLGEIESRLSAIDSISQRIDFLEGKDPDLAFKRELEQIESLYPEAKKTPTGLHYIVTAPGEGQNPSVGSQVTAHYTGTMMDGRTFDSSIERNKPFTFRVGMGKVIKGWDEAFLSMKPGEKRKLIVPSSLAYGEKAIGPIPANSILVFDVELIDFQ